LSSHPQHKLASELFSGFGGVLSFELRGGTDAAEALMAGVEIPLLAVSLGGIDTLIIRPAAGVHVNVDPKDREAAGITDGLIRFSTGLESADDIIQDLTQALNRR
jgi:cystathionine beta-lyase/cystathionine gamma-synthase